jgi:hypothetical protein
MSRNFWIIWEKIATADQVCNLVADTHGINLILGLDWDLGLKWEWRLDWDWGLNLEWRLDWDWGLNLEWRLDWDWGLD